MQRTVASELILGVRNTEGRLSKMLCDATKYFDERPSPNRVSHAGARCDGIRNLPRIARRKQPPAPLSTLCLLPLSHLPRRRPRPCRHAVPPPSHRAYALGLSLRAARRSSPPSTSPSQEIKSYQGGCAKRKPSLRVALLVLQLLFPCAAGRGRAALELVPHREHPLDDLEILRAAPVVEGEAAAVEDLAHGEREDLEALDEGLVVRVVDVDDDATMTIPTGFLP